MWSKLQRYYCLKNQLSSLTKDAEAVNDEICFTPLSDRPPKKRKLDAIIKEMGAVEGEIVRLEEELDISLHNLLAPYESYLCIVFQIAYQYCFLGRPKILNASIEELDTLEEIIFKLAELPRKNNVSVIQKFAAYLCSESIIYPSLLREIKEWGESRNSDFLFLVSEIEEDKSRNFKTNPALILKIDTESNNYQVDAWIILDKENYNPQEPINVERVSITPPSESTSFAELTKFCIGRILKTFFNQRDSRDDLRIIICVSSDLFDEPLNESEESVGACIESQYEVVFLCQDRLEQQYDKSVFIWKRKCQLLQENSEISVSQVFEHISGEEMLGNIDVDFWCRDNILGLVLSKVLSKNGFTTVFSYLFHSGIPSALWVRQGLLEMRSQDWLDDILRSKVKELPKTVKSVYQNYGFLRDRLALMWDEHLPPSIDYKM